MDEAMPKLASIPESDVNDIDKKIQEISDEIYQNQTNREKTKQQLEHQASRLTLCINSYLVQLKEHVDRIASGNEQVLNNHRLKLDKTKNEKFALMDNNQNLQPFEYMLEDLELTKYEHCFNTDTKDIIENAMGYIKQWRDGNNNLITEHSEKLEKAKTFKSRIPVPIKQARSGKHDQNIYNTQILSSGIPVPIKQIHTGKQDKASEKKKKMAGATKTKYNIYGTFKITPKESDQKSPKKVLNNKASSDPKPETRNEKTQISNVDGSSTPEPTPKNMMGTTNSLQANSTTVENKLPGKTTNRELFQQNNSDDDIQPVNYRKGKSFVRRQSTRDEPNYQNESYKIIGIKVLLGNPLLLQRTTENKAWAFLNAQNMLESVNKDSLKVADALKLPQEFEHVAIHPTRGITIGSMNDKIKSIDIKSGTLTVSEICSAPSDVSCLAVNKERQILAGN